MLRLIGSHYHFRRAVPVAVQTRLGRTEISLSLQTQSKLVARERAAALYARTGALFEKAKTMDTDLSREDLIAMLTEQGKIIREQEELLTLADEAFRAEKRALQADHAMTLMDQVQKEGAFISFATESLRTLETRLQNMMQKVFTASAVSKKEKDMLREQISSLSTLIVDLGKHHPAGLAEAPANSPPEATLPARAIRPASPLLSVMAEKFVFADRDKSEDTKKATRKTVELFTQAFGDMPVRQITGTIAGEFFDLLSGLPATHGKGHAGLPIREAVAQARERAQETVSGKTVKNHFSRLSALWMHLVQRDMAERNPWAGWDFSITRKIVRRGWTDDELALLARTPWKGTAVSQNTWAGIISIGMFTGMRLGEICNLRRQDTEVIDGVPCFHIRPHPEEGWSPKTAAGTRIIPVHSGLLRMKGLNLFQDNGEHYLFPDLTVSSTGERGDNFARAFSKHKKRIGIPEDVTFHSFRHTVSTKLRNQEAHIRELWIDTVLGHEASHKSQGTMTYTSRIEVANLKQVIEALHYPPECLIAKGEI
ncbi:DUF6538 domain-containing protein [Acetobacter thailandicus]|uniref:DUF6538 domain-containing protein n=1 Tax=Acetobacter thailandicus TaxID=1502842 RepID=UPI001BADB6F3|nr:DUF6538 domain-containing protein [Acetobacter thailandicus]MBS1003991.1 tyrosine-type recombinase/integrase [Acetobacter thailandicus]